MVQEWAHPAGDVPACRVLDLYDLRPHAAEKLGAVSPSDTLAQVQDAKAFQGSVHQFALPAAAGMLAFPTMTFSPSWFSIQVSK